jgi:hypothetical protein
MKSRAWATGRMSYQGLSQQLAISIIKGAAMAVSDGSLKDDMGTAAFHIEDSEEGDRVSMEGVLQVPGTPRESSSHRSKLGGLYGIVTVVEAVIQFHNITEGAVEVGCDGESALQAFDLEYYFDPQQADFDILTSIQAQIRDSPISWKPRHILGHQDRHNPHDIDHWAVLNIKMDSMAKAYWQEIAQNPDT